MLSASVTPTVVNTDLINIEPIQLPEDILPITLVASAKLTVASDCVVRYAIFSDRRLDPIAEGELNNIGVFPDISPLDSVFTGDVRFQVQRSFVGNLMLELLAQSSQGVTGTSFVQTILIQRLNQPPVLSNLQAPDTVRTSLQQSFLITVQASDPNGAADIVSVSRITSIMNTYFLNDSGLFGDAIAGDGVFTETVGLTPPPNPGLYQFSFRALDQLNARSNVLLHTIVVLP
ncbi:MAG: hypothetical protein WEB37_01415 [Bacteroidota bacterium]